MCCQFRQFRQNIKKVSERRSFALSQNRRHDRVHHAISFLLWLEGLARKSVYFDVFGVLEHCCAKA
jgi:hypothetical protein